MTNCELFFPQWIFLLSYSLSYFFFFLFSSALLCQWTEGAAQFIIAAVSCITCNNNYYTLVCSIFIGNKHTASSCLLCFSYVIHVPTDNSFMHAEVTSPNTLTSSLISFVMAELSSGVCIIKQLLDSAFA